MELKPKNGIVEMAFGALLIVPYGIETNLEHLLKHFQANF